MRAVDADKLLEEWDERTDDHRITDSEFHRMINEDLPLIELGWYYPAKGELPEKRKIPYQCLCKIHEVDEVENVFYASLWFDGSHFYMAGIDDLYWGENDYTNIVICWQYIIPPKEEA